MNNLPGFNRVTREYSPHPLEKSERNTELHQLRVEENWTYKDLAEKFNITPSRARTIYLRERNIIGALT